MNKVDIDTMCNHCTMDSLVLARQRLTTQMEQDAKRLETTATEHSDITAAMTLKAFGLKPGDIIKYTSLRRVRIENESMKGYSIGQPLEADGRASGRAIMLYEYQLSIAQKVT